ncbi:MAG: hypothetical protein E6J90_18675 [Deltaproteobacteria bacterium]|nr:MAG: hypothetical protein E6J90_18675 [Deltaproteobacteria bacterium]
MRDTLRQGQSIVVIGGRQTGKTWLVRRIRDSDVGRSVYFTSGDKLAFASEDFALRKFAKTLGLDWNRSWDVFDAREAIEAGLAAIGACVIVIDETDRILMQPWAGGFLAWLRSLIDTAGFGRTLAIVAVGGPVLEHYRNSQDQGSPVLNLARRLFLDPFDREAIDDLVAERDGAPTAAQVLEAAGGQPALAGSIAVARRGVARTTGNTRQAISAWPGCPWDHGLQGRQRRRLPACSLSLPGADRG